MKKLLGIFLLFVSTLGYSTVDCTTMQFLGASDNAIKISLPTTPDCDNPEYKIYQRIFASGPFTPSNFVLNTTSTQAKILDLDPCTKYQFRVAVFCNGENVGGCANGQPFATQCNDPTCDCINFIGIGIIDQQGCDAKLVMDFNAGTCGEISIIDYAWDFGYPGNPGANTEVVSHTFPGDGIYTVTAKLTYKLSTGEICTEVRTLDLKISDCNDPCECINFLGAAVVDQSECKYEMVMDFNAGTCGEISIIEYAWDFGYPGNGGANTEVVTHEFPSNGIYTVTTKLTFKIVETGEICTAVRETEIKVTECPPDPCECINFLGAAVVDQSECKYEMVMDFNAGTCGEISIIEYAWDFGYPGNGGANTEVVTHEFPSNGIYTITTKLTFKIVETGEICTAVRETELIVSDCPPDPCECINFFGAAVVDQSACKYEMVMDFNAGTCGEISILGYSWDFGYPGNGGANTEIVTHEFPSNGVYTITTKLAFKIVETGEVCVVVRETELIVSDCTDPCECINFLGASVVDQSECKFEMVMDFNAGTCGEISIIDYAWDFGYPGNGGANTEVVTHEFPGNGVYTITTKLTFKIVETGEICTAVRETELIVSDCSDPCECINFFGATVVDQSECKYEMVMDFNAGTCGEISILGYSWDFGYPGNGGANTEVVTHEFPSNGIYTITTKLSFKIVETGEVCTVVRETELIVTDCPPDPCECINFLGAAVEDQSACKYEMVMDFNAGTCGEISILGYSWDFGYPGNGGANTEVVTHEFPSNGVYTITTKLSFKIVETGEVCTVVRETELIVDDCDPCDCIFFPGIEILDQSECKAKFLMDFNAGTCGEISIVAYAWDFGYPGNSGGNTEVVTHSFPANGIYTVTAKLTFKIVATGEICSVKRTVDIKISDCAGFTGGDGKDRSVEGGNDVSKLTVKAFPNPFRNVVDLSINTGVDELINIDVLDINGRVVYNNSTDLQKGQNTYQLDLTHLPSGIYFYSLSTSKEIRTGKIIKE